jgi:hypothetical protein
MHRYEAGHGTWPTSEGLFDGPTYGPTQIVPNRSTRDIGGWGGDEPFITSEDFLGAR